jgi:hypothetical protein
MENQRLKDEAAAMMAQAAMEVIESCIDPVCHRDAYDEFLRIAHAGLDSYEVMRLRMAHRLNPMKKG